MFVKFLGFFRIGLVVVIFIGNKFNYLSNWYIYLKSKLVYVLIWGCFILVKRKEI